MSNSPVLALRDVSKSFGSIEVLHGVTLALEPGTVHALIGENGAGKSTTMKIMAGYQLPTQVDVQLDGATARFDSLHEGEMAGIVMIHQEFNLAEQLTVEQNIFLGRELKRGPLLDKAEMRRRTREYLDRVACDVSPDARVSTLSNSDKQMVEIAKALSRDARVLIMDEPTAALGVQETAQVENIIRTLKEAGEPLILISHNMRQVMDLCDRIVVFRRGRMVANLAKGDTDGQDVVAYITGAKTQPEYNFEVS